MIADTFGSVLLFAFLSFGLAWPIAARLSCSAAEKVLVSVALSLLGVFVVAWSIYVFALPLPALWVLPLGAAIGLGTGWRALREVGQKPEVRDLVIAQGIITAWCIGWLALVVTYSGGSWVGDWFGHWQRAVFFLERGPREILFNGFDPLTSRPPLANVVFGAFMKLTRNDFAHYQLACTFLGSLVFLPAALLARRFGGRAAIPILAMLVMLSPMFVQNATFAWTKLHAAFFTLAAFHFLLRAGSPDFRSAGILFGLTLAAALLTHYSAGPYALVFAGVWIGRSWSRCREAGWWRDTACAAIAGSIVLALWFGWALSIYGPRGTFLTNTSVTDQASTVGAQMLSALLNVRDTVVPHFLRDVDRALLNQASPWGWWRDWFFMLYQVNLLFLFGSVAWLVALRALGQAVRIAPPHATVAWGAGIATVVLLGVMVHGGRDTWGLAHICLQPLALFGLSFLAARWRDLGGVWRRVIVAGAIADFALGIALHFGAQSFLLDQWLAPQRTASETLRSYSTAATANWRAKLHFKFSFFGDAYVAYDAAILMLLGGLLVLALARAARRPA